MRSMDLAAYRNPQPFRWLSSRLWRIEHAFERARAADKAEDDTRLRMFIILVIFALGFVGLAGMASRAALFSNADKGVLATDMDVGDRADLVDRNGVLLAVDLPHFGLYFDPKQNWNVDEVRRDLLPLLPQLNPDRLSKALTADKRQYLLGGLTPDEKDRIDDLGLPGIEFEPESKRVYPMGPTAAHLIGFVDRGEVGLSGAELALNKQAIADAGKGPLPLSIDLRVQAAVDDELAKAVTHFGAIGGVGIVTNVRTGEILAMSSSPTFDPNAPGATPIGNMINHAAATVYEPGSVFKVFTVAMGLDSGVATLNTPFDVHTPLELAGGRTIHDFDKGAPVLPLWGVFTHSSNIGAARLGLMAGPQRMQTYFKNFGLFNAAPSELAESARPLYSRDLNQSTLASMAFGQAISVSPLSLATAMGSVFNGGEYIPLTIRKRGANDIPQGRRVISEETSRQMLDLMRRNAVEGTGRTADQAAPGYRLGGKTGTAQKAIGGRYEADKRVSSLAAIFPTDGPLNADRYFVYILLDEAHAEPGTYGFATAAWNAGPAAGKVIERIAPYLGVQRAPIAPSTAAKSFTPAEINGGEQ